MPSPPRCTARYTRAHEDDKCYPRSSPPRSCSAFASPPGAAAHAQAGHGSTLAYSPVPGGPYHALCLQHRAMGLRVKAIGPLGRLIIPCPRQVGLPEISPDKVGPPEVSPCKVGLLEPRSGEIGMLEVRALQLGVVQFLV